MKKQILSLGILLGLIGFVSAHIGDDSYGHHGMMSGGYGYGFSIFGWITGLLVIVVLVLLIIWLAKQIQKK